MTNKVLFTRAGVESLQQQRFLAELLAVGSCDRERAERAIVALHEAFKLPPPSYFFWYESPPRAQLAAGLLATVAREFPEETKRGEKEFRRLMVDRVGAVNYLRETGAKVIHTDQYEVL